MKVTAWLQVQLRLVQLTVIHSCYQSGIVLESMLFLAKHKLCLVCYNMSMYVMWWFIVYKFIVNYIVYNKMLSHTSYKFTVNCIVYSKLLSRSSYKLNIMLIQFTANCYGPISELLHLARFCIFFGQSETLSYLCKYKNNCTVFYGSK